jgi:hypothetical protein
MMAALQHAILRRYKEAIFFFLTSHLLAVSLALTFAPLLLTKT